MSMRKGHHRYKNMPFLQYFWDKINALDDTDCWIYVGSKDKDGYGLIKNNQHLMKSHRVAWELTHKSEIPDGMMICHYCDNPPCCNPYHLFLGTMLDNARDMIDKGRKVSSPGERNGATKLTWEHVARIRSIYTTGEVTQAKLASDFGVSQSLIGLIVRGDIWK